MKKSFTAVAGSALFFVAAQTGTANAAPKCWTPPEEHVFYVRDSKGPDLRKKTITMARETIDLIFPAGAAKDPVLADAYKDLSGMLDKLPNASLAERNQISKDAYKIRVKLESAENGWLKYKYSYFIPNFCSELL